MKKIFSLSLFLLFTSIVFGQNEKESYALNIATYNLRLDLPSDGLDAWEHRKENVNGLIRFHDFDIVGTQEGFHHQLLDIIVAGDYGYVGVGRDDGVNEGEHSAILYKKDRFEVLDNGDFWFSETLKHPPSDGKQNTEGFARGQNLETKLLVKSSIYLACTTITKPKKRAETLRYFCLQKLMRLQAIHPHFVLATLMPLPMTNLFK